MFGSAPAGLALLATILLATAGGQTNTELTLPINPTTNAEATIPPPSTNDSQQFRPNATWIGVTSIVVIMTLVWAIQQSVNASLFGEQLDVY